MTCCPEQKKKQERANKIKNKKPESKIAKWLYRIGRADIEKDEKSSSVNCH